ncbi:hypothetical protein E0Z10_g2023 [Xylaria hypoxylon]|uniref:Uncharacterized protein n=1 Tax=Xylaria hypoxylon TaxID=37992 RepID=A0A4Z0Z769_9PEZI|nr:hypothetical protein E0Z10_g2023 [Xylaria hypoxylon]
MSNIAVKRTTTTALSTSGKDFAGATSASMRLVADKSKKAAEWAVANPGKTAAFGAGAALIAVPMVVAAPVLGAIGFGANGIIAGSAAAGIQSGIGSVVAPSIFATLQSAAAGGYGIAAVSAAIQGAGTLVASVGAMSLFRKKENQGDDNAATELNEERALSKKADQEDSGHGKDGDESTTATL